MQKECRQGDGQKPRPGIGISFQPQLRHHHIQFPITGRTSTPSSKVSSNSDPNGPQARRIARRICGKCASQRVLATDVARIRGKKTPSPAAFAENVSRSAFQLPTRQEGRLLNRNPWYDCTRDNTINNRLPMASPYSSIRSLRSWIFSRVKTFSPVVAQLVTFSCRVEPGKFLR